MTEKNYQNLNKKTSLFSWIYLALLPILLTGCQSLVHRFFDPPPPPLEGKREYVIPEMEVENYTSAIDDGEKNNGKNEIKQMAGSEKKADKLTKTAQYKKINYHNEIFTYSSNLNLPKLVLVKKIDWTSGYIFPFVGKPIIDDNKNIYLMDHGGRIIKSSLLPQKKNNKNSATSWTNKDLFANKPLFRKEHRMRQGVIVLSQSIVGTANEKEPESKINQHKHKITPIIVATTGSGEIAGIDVSSGKAIWKNTLSNVTRSDLIPLDQFRVLLSGTDDALYVISTIDGSILWSDIGKKSIGKPRTLGQSTIIPVKNTTGDDILLLKYMDDGSIKFLQLPQKPHEIQNEDLKRNKEWLNKTENNIPTEVFSISAQKFSNNNITTPATPLYSAVIDSAAENNWTKEDKIKIYTSTKNNKILSINIKNKTIEWGKKYNISDPIAGDKDRIYFLDRKKSYLVAVNKNDGSVAWNTDISGAIPADNIIQEVLSSEKRWLQGPLLFMNYLLMIEQRSGDIHFFSTEKGELLNKYNFEKRILSATIDDKNQKILLNTNNGQLLVISAEEHQQKMVALNKETNVNNQRS